MPFIRFFSDDSPRVLDSTIRNELDRGKSRLKSTGFNSRDGQGTVPEKTMGISLNPGSGVQKK
jgi:hypothetical protein